ncbi:DUF4395 domain-containing protein [Bacillus shivajii]|uniref:DUF4395 domain-containing protein n=1 Tax=Bacillus shivajii TaxID=1983719 RepID=UPI001CF9E0F3|nr:DUF4395 domain-containing protein [Bacillus shivajii]UCZ55149.1 DUF4395 domain-containing protein [Bacillus shivajii]
MKEIPITLVRANQIMMVILTLASIVTQNIWILILTAIFIYSSLIFGPKANVAFIIAKSITKKDLSTDHTESAVLTRFNQTIAASIITVAIIIYLLTGHWVTWLLVAMVTVAASVALMGFCVGCFLYYQFKKQTYKLKSK